jgi:hypothetical protein
MEYIKWKKMNVEKLLAKAVQQEIDLEIMSQLLDGAGVTNEEKEMHLQKMREKESNEMYRIVNDMSNNNVHKTGDESV